MCFCINKSVCCHEVSVKGEREVKCEWLVASGFALKCSWMGNVAESRCGIVNASVFKVKVNPAAMAE